MDEEDTLVVPKGRKEMRLLPKNKSLEREVVMDLEERQARVGRAAGDPSHPNFYPLPSKVVSRTHADFWEADGKFYIKDLGSTSGTFLNGKRLSPAGIESTPFEVSPNDVVQFGTNYTEDEARLSQDPSLRCTIVTLFFRQQAKLAAPQMGTFGSPDRDVDLNNLTYVMRAAQISKQDSPASYGTPPGSGFHRSSSRDEIMSSDRKNSSPDLYQMELNKKKELEERLKNVQQKASSVLMGASTDSPKDQFIVSVVRQNHKVIKIMVQAGNKDVFTVNIKAWDANKKLLIQDHRLKFSKSPYLEVIMDPTVKTGTKYHVINHNGGSIMATVEKSAPNSGKFELPDGTLYQAVGDLGEGYKIHLNGSLITEVVVIENERNTPKGNLSRILNVLIEKDHNHQLILSAVVIFALISP